MRVGVADLSPHNASSPTAVCRSARRAGCSIVEGVTDGAEITRRLAAHDLFVNELIPVRADLESVFLELTADEGLETIGAAR